MAGRGLGLLLLSAAACSGSAVQVPGTARPAPTTPVASVPIDRFAGEWEGVYYRHPHVMGMKATLRAAGGTEVAGEVELYALRDERGIARPSEGSYSVRGTYDPVLRTFRLAPGAWAGPQRQAGRPFTLEGVFDPGQPALAGQVGHGPNERLFFTLTRPDRVADLTRRASLNPPRARGGRMPDDDGLIAWASRLADEHPDVDPRRTPMGRLFELGANLFEDDYFRAHFGKTYDLLSAGERRAVRERFDRSRPRLYGGGLQRLRGRNPNEELRELAAFGRAFDESVAPGAYHVVHAVLAQRVIRAWRAGQLARIAAMPPAPDTFDDLDRVAAAGQDHLRTLWPTEQSDFQHAVAGVRQRIAVPALAAMVDELVAAPPSYDAALALSRWERGRERLLAAVPADVRAAERRRALTRLDEVLDHLVAREVASLDGLGAGMGAVEAGNRWYADLSQRYAFAMDRPPVRAAVAQLQARRSRDLALGRPTITMRISRQATKPEVDALVRDLLAVPGDAEGQAGRAVLDMAERRKSEIRRARMVAELQEMVNCVEAHNRRDYAAAAPYCRAAADRGNSQAQRMLAGLYKMGSGVPMNQARARALYDQACNGGDRHGCFYLGMMLIQAEGGPRNLVRGRSLLEQACSGGTAGACYTLGVMVNTGTGGPRDTARAQALFRRACDSGIAPACEQLR